MTAPALTNMRTTVGANVARIRRERLLANRQMAAGQREAAVAAVERAGVTGPMVRWWPLPRVGFRQGARRARRQRGAVD